MTTGSIRRYVHFLTLQPYYLIYTRTPATFPGKRRALQAGDVVEIEIEGIGTLRNRIDR
jgi:2-keto-4-pentenoate hydratase/2-oxohepta-3-ene-1,7-dioic acid hydratase in catechol pathway